MPELSRKVIEKLLVHVRLGCLSFIPVSGGTSRNECPHKIFESSVLSIFEEEESHFDNDNKSLEAIEVDIHTDTQDDEISKWDIDAEHVKNLIKQVLKKAKMIDHIKDCEKTELLEPRFFTSLTVALYLLNPSSARETSNEQDQADCLKEIYNLFCLLFCLLALFYK